MGGAGLLAGSLLAVAAHRSGPKVFGVEPEAADDARRSVASGAIVQIDLPDTIADGARTRRIGELTFPIVRDRVAAIVTVPEVDLVDAMRTMWTEFRMTLEPTGVLGFAGLRTMGGALRGGRVGVILSGGNVDPARFRRLIGEGV